jgi:uncharacterized DUF497 family protein
MGYEWDDQKNAGNAHKHGAEFASIEQFDWEGAVFLADDRFDYGEDRVRAYGRIDGRPHCVVFVLRSQNMRIISLRPMHEKEAKRYGI